MTAHPDRGGSDEFMRELNEAADLAQAETFERELSQVSATDTGVCAVCGGRRVVKATKNWDSVMVACPACVVTTT